MVRWLRGQTTAAVGDGCLGLGSAVREAFLCALLHDGLSTRTSRVRCVCGRRLAPSGLRAGSCAPEASTMAADEARDLNADVDEACTAKLAKGCLQRILKSSCGNLRGEAL